MSVAIATHAGMLLSIMRVDHVATNDFPHD